VETLFRWGRKRLHDFVANLLRKLCNKFPLNCLSLIEDIMQNILGSFFSQAHCIHKIHYTATKKQWSVCVSRHFKRSRELWLVLAAVVNCLSVTRRWFLDVWMLIGLSVFGWVTVLQLLVFCCPVSCVMDSVCRKPSVRGRCWYECPVSCWRGSVQLETGTAVDLSLMNQTLVTDWQHMHSDINYRQNQPELLAGTLHFSSPAS